MKTIYLFLTIALLSAFGYCATSHAEMDVWIERNGNNDNIMTLFIDIGKPVDLNETSLSQYQIAELSKYHINYIHPIYALQFNMSENNLTLDAENISEDEIISLLPGVIEGGRLSWLIDLDSSSYIADTNSLGAVLKGPANPKLPPNPFPNDCFYDGIRLICV